MASKSLQNTSKSAEQSVAVQHVRSVWLFNMKDPRSQHQSLKLNISDYLGQYNKIKIKIRALLFCSDPFASVAPCAAVEPGHVAFAYHIIIITIMSTVQ